MLQRRQEKNICQMWSPSLISHTFLHTPTWPGRVLCQVPPIMLCSCVVKWVKRMAIPLSHPPPELPNFHPLLPPLLLTLSSAFPLWSCSNLHWGRPPAPTLKFPPFFLPLHLNSLLLTFLLDFTGFHSHHHLLSASFHPYFTFSDWIFLFFPSDLQLSIDILPISASYSLPSVSASHCTDQSISISCIPLLLSSILSWIRNKAGSHYPPSLQPTHPATPSASDWAWLVNLPEAFSV